MTANNVIKFPTLNDEIAVPPRNPEQLGDYFTKNKKEYVDHICEHYTTSLYNKLGGHGFDVLNDDFVTYFTYTTETLRHCLYNSLDIEHPLASHIEEMIDLIELEDDLPNLD
jgi:hypothetical protein|tara:strand:+ start:374 stop:709 length:336 start_codon:yes stop_codon:yes gene_type:complete